jgi:hypothetical protein
MMSSTEVIQEARGMENADRHGQAPAFARHILAPTDLTPGAKKTVDCAIAFARCGAFCTAALNEVIAPHPKAESTKKESRTV